jgi:hypothetical protein
MPLSYARKARNQTIRANDVNELQSGVESLDGGLTTAQLGVARVDPGTTLAADEVISGDGAGNPIKRTYRAIGVPWVNPRSDGLSLDGMSNERDDFVDFLAAQPTGSVVAFDDRANLRIDSQVKIENKTISLVGHGLSTISTPSIPIGPLLWLMNAPDSRVEGFILAGGETSFVNTSSADHYALKFLTSPRSSVQGIRMSGFSQGINADTCHHFRADDIQFDGLITGHETWDQHHTTIHIIRSDYTQSSRIAGRNCGIAFLAAGGSSNQGRVWGVDAINCWDNGLYVNGHDWDIDKVVAKFTVTPTGSVAAGVKMRGSRNHVHHGSILNYPLGVLASGYGTTLTTDGYNGVGSSITEMKISDVVVWGIALDTYMGYTGRDFVVARNYLERCGTAAGTANNSIHVVGTATSSFGYVTIADNDIVNQAGLGNGVRFTGATTAAPFVGGRILRNRFRGFSGHNQCYPIRATWAPGLQIEGNEFETVTSSLYAVDIDNSNDLLITGNRKRGTVGITSTINVQATCNTPRIYLNHNCTVAGTGTSPITTP